MIIQIDVCGSVKRQLKSLCHKDDKYDLRVSNNEMLEAVAAAVGAD
jgi:hypothetical protein